MDTVDSDGQWSGIAVTTVGRKIQEGTKNYVYVVYQCI